MKVRILKKFTDTQVNRQVQPGEVYEVTQERGVELINHPAHVAEEYKDALPTDAPEAEVETPAVKESLTPPLKAPEIETPIAEETPEATKPKRRSYGVRRKKAK